MLEIAVSAFALSLAVSAAAQTTRGVQDVAPNATAAQAAIPGQSVLDGSWAVLPLVPGTLTLSTGANGNLSGTLSAGSYNVACRGQYHGLGFFVMCDVPGTPVVFTANAEVEQPVATQRGRVRAGRARLRGRTYLAQPSAQGMSVIEGVFLGEPN